MSSTSDSPTPAAPAPTPAASASTVAAPVREEMIGPAVRFLTDEKVKSAPMAKKIAFLESKGLTSQEIDVAVARASGGSVASAAAAPPVPVPTYAPLAPPVPAPAPWTAKDVVVTAAAIGGLGYASYALFTAYVLPKLPIPSMRDLTDSQTQFRAALAATSETVAAVQADAAKSLAQLHADADALHTAATDAQKALANAANMVTERDAQLAAVVKDMADLRDQVPKMVDQARDAQLAALSDLQNEIRSLRMAVVASSATPNANGPATAASDAAGPAASFASAAAAPRTLVATPPPSLAVGPAKIPDWQVKAAKKAKAATVQAASLPASSSSDKAADVDASSASASTASSAPSSPVKERSTLPSPVSAAN